MICIVMPVRHVPHAPQIVVVCGTALLFSSPPYFFSPSLSQPLFYHSSHLLLLLEAPQCVPECSTHGQCKNGQCFCDQTWSGPTCSTRMLLLTNSTLTNPYLFDAHNFNCRKDPTYHYCTYKQYKPLTKHHTGNGWG